ncbi:MAG: hypothetical protein RLZZ502_44, partial [Pseudomonadota bacterium]
MTERKTHLDSTAVVILLTCCVFWAAQQILLKVTIDLMSPVLQVSVRFAGATVLLWLWCAFRGIALFNKDGSLMMGLLAGVLFAVEFAFLYLGMKYTSASRLTLFVYTSPFWVASILPWLVPSERLNKMQKLGLILAYVAVALALSDGLIHPSDQNNMWLGDVLAVLAGLGWGLTTVVIRATVLGKAKPEKVLFYQLAVATLLLPFISGLIGESWQFSWSGPLIISLLIQTVFGAFASYLAWMWMLAHYPASKLSASVFLTPV